MKPYELVNFSTVEDLSKRIGWNASEKLRETIALPKAHKNIEKQSLEFIDKFKVTHFTGVTSERLSKSIGYFYDNRSSTKTMRKDIISILEGPKIEHYVDSNFPDIFEECNRC